MLPISRVKRVRQEAPGRDANFKACIRRPSVRPPHHAKRALHRLAAHAAKSSQGSTIQHQMKAARRQINASRFATHCYGGSNKDRRKHAPPSRRVCHQKIPPILPNHLAPSEESVG
jgi:hypothetical protein